MKQQRRIGFLLNVNRITGRFEGDTSLQLQNAKNNVQYMFLHILLPIYNLLTLTLIELQNRASPL